MPGTAGDAGGPTLSAGKAALAVPLGALLGGAIGSVVQYLVDEALRDRLVRHPEIAPVSGLESLSRMVDPLGHAGALLGLLAAWRLATRLGAVPSARRKWIAVAATTVAGSLLGSVAGPVLGSVLTSGGGGESGFLGFCLGIYAGPPLFAALFALAAARRAFR